MIDGIPFDWLDILTVTLMSFSVVLVLSGIFTAYFGNGRSRAYGFTMIAVGTVVGTVWICSCAYVTAFNINVFYVLATAFINMAAILAGGAIAIAIFLILVLKS